MGQTDFVRYLGFCRFIKLVDFLALFWTMRRWLATWCVPCITSFSHNYMLGGSQHAFQIFQAGCLLFAFCYVWMSPDCGTHGVGSWTGWVILSHAYQHDALYPCRVVYLHGFGVKKCWSGGQTLVILRSQFDMFFRVTGKLKDCVSLLFPRFWYLPTNLGMLFSCVWLVLGDLPPLSPYIWT